MKTYLKRGLMAVAAVVAIAVVAFCGLYLTRFKTMASVEKLTDYSDYNLYSMDVSYDYNLDDITNYGITDNQSMVDAIVKEAIPVLPVHIEVPNFGCSALGIKATTGIDAGHELTGRNYDFNKDTSCMLVHAHPKGGYESIAFAALDNVGANDATGSSVSRVASLTAPFICLDGVNERGVAVAVLMVSSESVNQNTGKPKLPTTIAIRMILDQAATTDEAIKLLKKYDMFAQAGGDYHFYVNDASGNAQIIEYDPESKDRSIVATPVDAVTNFYQLYSDRVLTNQKNGIYGYGKERYEAIQEVFSRNSDAYSEQTAWDALKASSQTKESGATSNTQWSIVFDNTDCSAKVAFQRNWDEVYDCKVDGQVSSK